MDIGTVDNRNPPLCIVEWRDRPPDSPIVRTVGWLHKYDSQTPGYCFADKNDKPVYICLDSDVKDANDDQTVMHIRTVLIFEAQVETVTKLVPCTN